MPCCRAAAHLEAVRYVLVAVLVTLHCCVSYGLGPAQVGSAEEKGASPWSLRRSRQLEATSGSGEGGRVPRPLSDEDLVFVTGTDGQRLPLAQASSVSAKKQFFRPQVQASMKKAEHNWACNAAPGAAKAPVWGHCTAFLTVTCA